jgi:DNA (cytosine-5)-methyltransferase 1
MTASGGIERNLTAISLFSGCGGLDLGAERAGLRVEWASDAMPECAESIQSLLPEVKFHLGDIRLTRKFPVADVVLGGYPCQPFSMGGARNPAQDKRARLFSEFARAVEVTEPRYFVAENVQGLRNIGASQWLEDQLTTFRGLGRRGYHVSVGLLDAADYGVPQRRKRLFLVGVRKDLRQIFVFPDATHGAHQLPSDAKKCWVGHGDVLATSGFKSWPRGEFYERPLDTDAGFSWWYMSRNRKAAWDDPARTVLANDRQVALHPGCADMQMVSSDWRNRSRQTWQFTSTYSHTNGHPDRLVLDRPRRLSWRECSVLQTFPREFEPVGSLQKKYEQIGNAVPPVLAEAVLRGLVDGSGFVAVNRLTDSQRLPFGLKRRGHDRP